MMAAEEAIVTSYIVDIVVQALQANPIQMRP